MITLTTDGADRTVNVPAGEDVVVALPENPSTGYRWVVEAVTGALTLVSSDYVPAAGATPGAGGRRTIHVRADRRGRGELRLRSQRTTEAASPDARRCRLTFHIA